MSPACAGESALFESVARDDHELAAMICNDCDFITQCRALRDQRGIDGGYLWHHGTWAGELWCEGRRIDPVTRKEIGARPPRTCVNCEVDLPPGTHNTAKYCDTCRRVMRLEQQAKHDEKHKHTRTTSRHRWYGVSNDRTCPDCGALPGKPCAIPRKDRKSPRITHMHMARREPMEATA